MPYYLQIIMKIKLGEQSRSAGSGSQSPKIKHEDDKLEIYAKRIQKLERQLGIEITDFSNCGID